MSIKNILFIGQINGRACYYNFLSGEILTYIPDYVKTGEGKDSNTLLHALRTPLVGFISILIYIVYRNMNMHVIGAAVSIPFFTILSCAAGAAMALLLADSNKRNSAKQIKAAVTAGPEEREAACRQLRKDTVSVTVFLPVLIAFLAGMPVILGDMGTVIVFISYLVGWFLFWMIVLVFRIGKRWKAVLALKGR